MDRDERFWPARVRWRLRGAWMWPTFVAITLLDGLILHLLPPIGTGVDPVPAILIATFGNLVLIGAVAPWLARRIWKRRPAAAPGAGLAAPAPAARPGPSSRSSPTGSAPACSSPRWWAS